MAGGSAAAVVGGGGGVVGGAGAVVVGGTVVVGSVPAARCKGMRVDAEPHAPSASIARPTATPRLVTGWVYTADE